MKIVILDPYFESLGGGEKVIVVMAQHLALQHDVIILVKKPVDKDMVGKYFDTDLTRVRFEPLPKESFFVRAITSRYARLPGRWKSIIYDRGSLRALKSMKPDMFINNLYQSNLPSPAPKSIYMCMFPQKLTPGTIYHGMLRRFYNRLTTLMEARLLGTRRQAIDSYTIVTANSKYTSGWIKKYWGREPDILYPVCDDMGPPLPKKHIIMSAGRFFADNGSSHHKRQDKMLAAFIALDRPDWDLHLAGSVAEDSDSQDYFKSLQDTAEGRPNIFIHPNMPFADIKRLRQEAAIYWHATGLGYDPDVFPENQEHFGMVTAEAMSAGAVPIVYNSAGQTEVVTKGKNGFLWNSIDELLEQTRTVMDNDKLRSKLSKAAVKRAREFDRAAFLKRVDQLILEVTHGRP